MKSTLKQIVRIRSLRFGVGCLFAITSFTVSLYCYDNLKAGVLFAVLFILTGAILIQGELIPPHILSIIYIGWFILTAFATLVLSQFCLNEVLPKKGIFVTFLGFLLILTLCAIPAVLSLRIRISTIAVSGFLIVFTCVNYFVFLFRGSEIAPADILSITTAGNVAAKYSFRVPAAMFYALMLSAIYFFASFALPALYICRKRYVRIFGILSIILGLFFVWVGGLTVQPLHFLQSGSVVNGYLLNFTLLLRESFPTEPKGYSPEIVDAISEHLAASGNQEEHKPDIIVVMDESFASLEQLGNPINTDVEVTPFIDSLTENTLKGKTLSSVFGGGTPNSEYEFLTGNTCLFLPTGAIAYQQFVKGPSYSVARVLKDKGYSTVAMHQYLPNSWMRERIWPLLGFDKCLFYDDFPQQDLFRNMGTDQELFEKLTSLYEEHITASDSPVFMFAVSLQNHGGYEYSESDYTSTVHLQGYERSYPDVEQYLTCIHKTDQATEWLINYYDQIDRDVIVLFYGDHYPKLNDKFYEEVHGGAFDSLNDQMLQYEVPFFIWTNYETTSEEIELTSMNYLSGFLYQRANLEMPEYNQYLEQVRQLIPACNSLGYYSYDAGQFLALDDAQGEEKKKLLEYNYLEWNSLFDEDNKNSSLFPS